MVYATVALNQDASTLIAGYSQAVAGYGRPLRLQAAMCFEAAAGIDVDTMAHRGSEAYLAGPSTADQARLLQCRTMVYPFCNHQSKTRSMLHMHEHSMVGN